MKRILASIVLMALLFRTKEGPGVYYNDNGQCDSKGTYNDGKKEGHWVSYYDNGQLDYDETKMITK